MPYIPALRFPSLTRLYDPAMRFTLREDAIKGALLEAAGVGPGMSVLDVGAGTGTLAVLAAHRGADVTALDGDPAILEIARTKAAGLPIRFVQALSTEDPFPERSFDRVLSTLFFHHLTADAKVATLRNALRWLRPGGEIHVADWGEPQDLAMRTLFFGVQLLDGFETTRDHVAGRFPAFLELAGFRDVAVGRSFRTVYGTLAFYRGVAPSVA